MTDTNTETTKHFETDEVSATRGREQGLGMGARKLDAQRDAGGGRCRRQGSRDAMEENLGVQGQEEEDDPKIGDENVAV